MPHWQAACINTQLSKLSENIAHRQSIMQVYANELSENLINPNGLIRGAVLVKNREKTLDHLAHNGFSIYDTWYDKPIGPARKYPTINYPETDNIESVEFTRKVVNLPTHIHITTDSARKIAASVKESLL